MKQFFNILELLKMGDFFVPNYQRGYSWGEKQINDFWEDISNINENNCHYMGTLILSKDNINYKIIDGQQRLLTILIALNVLKENYYKENDIDIKKTIFLNYEEDKKENYYKEKFRNAKKEFKQKLEKLESLNKIEKLKEIYNKLTTQLIFNCHIIENEFNVHIMFETINNRGKKLSNLELLKNRLLYLITLLDISNDEKQKLSENINSAWSEIYNNLGQNTKKILSDDEFLQAHWVVYMREHESKRYDELFEIFSSKKLNNDNFKEEIEDYINDIKDFSKYWYYTFFPEDSTLNLSDMEKEWLASLNRIDMTYFRPLIAVILKNNEDINEVKDEEFKKTIEIFKSIERFIFIIFKLGKFSSAFCATDIRYYSRNIYNTEKWKESIKNKIFDKDSIWLEKEGELKDTKSLFSCLIEDLIYFLDTTADFNLEYALEKFRKEMSSKYKNGFYSWDGLKYFLEEYEYELSYTRKNEEMNWENFKNKEVSIEHIIPQTFTNAHKKEIQAYKGLNKEEVLEILSKALGNFLLIPEKLNSSLQNKEFEDKRNEYKKAFLSATDVAKFKNTLDIEIKNRSKNLLDFMEDRWLFSYPESFFNFKIKNNKIETFRKAKYLEWMELEPSTKETINKLKGSKGELEILANPFLLFKNKK